MAAMDCYYINLDSADDRKRHVEKNFAVCKKPNWTLTRSPAIDKTFVAGNNIAGDAKPAEKGCFLSHQMLMRQRLDDDKSYFIMEDDAAFGVHTCAHIDLALEQNKTADWDILFTDVCIPDMPVMFELLKYRRELAKRKIDVVFMNLGSVRFAGSTAYIVNGKSKRKIHEMLRACQRIDQPYDLYLRQLAHGGALNIYSLFPFVTTLSEFCDESQIKVAGDRPVELTWNIFRRMIWTERNLKRCKSTLEAFRKTWCEDKPPVKVAGADEELSAFTHLFSSMAAIRA
ncbi:MAG: glycosyltransferase family 25 protein [Pseudolabrys sp.]